MLELRGRTKFLLKLPGLGLWRTVRTPLLRFSVFSAHVNHSAMQNAASVEGCFTC